MPRRLARACRRLELVVAPVSRLLFQLRPEVAVLHHELEVLRILVEQNVVDGGARGQTATDVVKVGGKPASTET